MMFRIIGEKKAKELSLARKCALFGVSASGFYAWKRRKPTPPLAAISMASIIPSGDIPPWDTKAHAASRRKPHRPPLFPGKSRAKAPALSG